MDWNVTESYSKIIVIDDDSLNRQLIDTYLSQIGYQVCSAINGEEGLAMVRQERPDLILLDIMMPDIDGYEVCRQVRADPEFAYIPIVMVTALRETEQRIAALESGADDFLSKPFSVYDLAARVKSLLRIKHQHDELERRNKLFYHVMTRYMAPEVSEQILTNPERYLQLGGESRQITVLFADIRGFTRYAQTHSPKRVVELLNSIFKELAETILTWRGTLDKFMGDAMMAIYGAPISYQDDTLRAALTALEMRAAFSRLQETWTDEQECKLGLGIGIHTGEAVVGNVGTERLMNYTAIGDTVNIAQRLEELAQGGHILISEETYRRIESRAKGVLFGVQTLRGREQETTIYQLTDMLM
ncbi:MAG: response regulator [Anaerolineae bacterium]|nr:response regulator [Anaerolineae bacterium]